MRRQDYPGTFIVIEGADGAGTTTQSKRLADELDAHWTNEPTGNKIGRKIDELVAEDGYDAETVALAFAADRMVHLEDEIIPRLENGETVVCDRYYHSSLVYQPVMGAEYSWVKKLNRDALTPDCTVIIDVSPEVGEERRDKRGEEGNMFEEKGFQEKVITGYRRLEDRLDEPVNLVDGSGTKEDVFQAVKNSVPD